MQYGQMLNRGLEMKFIKYFGLILVVILCKNGYAIVCGDSNLSSGFKIHYSCGAGTLKSGQTLPESTSVVFGASVQPVNITTTYCTAPANHVWNGQEIVVNGEVVAFNTTRGASPTFKYKYTHDITVQPHWVPLVTKELAESTLDLYIGHENGLTGSRFETNWSNWTWTSIGYAFYLQGAAFCSPIEPQNTNLSAGIIPNNQTELEAEYARRARDGRVCYCKMTNPSVEGSRWIVGNIYPSAGSCTYDCVSMCGAQGHRTLGTRRAYLSGLLTD